MKLFNLEQAKAGKPVCTRDGHPVRILTFNRKNTRFPIVALVKYGDVEEVYVYTIHGGAYLYGGEHELDLVMVEETININGHEVPTPECEPLGIGQAYYTPDMRAEDMYAEFTWNHDCIDYMSIGRNLVHLTKENAITHAKALLSLMSDKSND